jgi:hypothetical protein
MKKMACVLAFTAGAGLGAAALAPPALAETAVTPAASGLQLSISAAGTIANDAAVTLDVRFEGGSLRVVELLVDGVTIKKKNLATRNSRGHIEFQMEAGLLSEGTHDILVKAQDADGNTATTSTQLKVTGGASGLVKFQFPLSKSMVQGVVPIEIKLDPSIHNPYVSFFVDDTFLGLTNYAPYTVNWDSTRVSNGLHTVSVEVYDGDTLAKLKSTSLQININNPGGLTTRQNEIADLNKGGKEGNKVGGAQPTASAVKSVVDASRYSAAPKNGLEFQAPASKAARLLESASAENLPRLGNNLNSAASTVRPVSPFAPTNKTNDLLPPVAEVNDITRATPNALADINRHDDTLHHPGTRVMKPGMLGLLASPREFSVLQTTVTLGKRPAMMALRPRRAGNMAVRPALTMDMEAVSAPNDRLAIHALNTVPAPSIAAPVIPPVTKAFANTTSKVTPIQIALGSRALAGPSARMGRVHSFQIAFDNTRIAFDVQPRIQRGLPLAPFRQIFEHTGGTIQWFNQSKTLRAFNSDREIEFKIGDDEAKVNNQMVKMEAKTYLEKGRTIVPLSFVRDALNVNVSYDATTGHLRIESKK